MKPTLEELLKRVDRSDKCWIWLKARNSKEGYGRVWCKGELWHTHRLVWELVNGPIPAGLYVCHKCDNPPCVNPDHLFLGGARENRMDAYSKGRVPLKRRVKEKTNCGKGHPYTNGNIVIQWNGNSSYKACLICKRASVRNWYAKNKEDYNKSRREKAAKAKMQEM